MEPRLSTPPIPADADATALAARCPVDHGGGGPTEAHRGAERSPADRRMRRLLRLPEDGPRVSVFAAQSAFSRSIAISATRCLLTYVFIPLMGPLVGLTGSVGPILGLVIGTISMVAIVASTRRFFAADHRWRWGYAAIGGSILVLLAVQAVVDLSNLVS